MLYVLKSVIVAAFTVYAVYFAATRFLAIAALIRSGKAEKLTDTPAERAFMVFRMVFAHERLLKDPIAGVLHLVFLYGFLVLGAGHTELLLEGLTAFLSTLDLPVFSYSMVLPDVVNHLYHLSQDVMAALVLLMCFVALGRRWSGQVKRLMPRSTDAEIILWFIAMLYVTFFVYVPSNLVLKQGVDVGFLWWAPVSSMIAQGVAVLPSGVVTVVNEIFFFAHLSVFLGFAMYLPTSKHMHLVFAGPNTYFFHKETTPKGLPPKIDFTDENLEKYGVDRVYEYSWKTLLDTFACTECGRCNAVCPAHLTGKPLQPKKVLHDIKINLKYKNGDDIASFHDKFGNVKPDKADAWKAYEPKVPLLNKDEIDHADKAQVRDDGTYLKVDGQVHLDEAWACTTCGACIEACPVLIDSVPGSLIGLRQTQVMMQSEFPEELTAAFKGMETQGNPWGVGQDKREDWAADLDVKTMATVAEGEKPVEYLFWVGCAGATDDRAKKTQKSMVKILKAAKVDFAILGCEEKCTGDPARRMGNEYVFDSLRQENVAVMEQYEGKFKKVFTACPHCFNSLKNEYNQYDDKYAAQKVSVQHHTELLAELLKDKRIPLDAAKKIEEHVTLHDPCYVSRYNDEVDAPRDVLAATPGVELTEMERHGKKSFCCGAGGGRMFMEEHIGKRVNVERTEEALVALNTKKKPKQTIAVGCPFCMTMLTDGTKAKDVEESVKVKDIAEILAERLTEAAPTA
jgi:Fe-S oxidoreductase